MKSKAIQILKTVYSLQLMSLVVCVLLLLLGQALMKFIGEETFNALAQNKDYVITESQGFNSTNKFSQARIEKTGKTFYKGAPERLLAAAKSYLDKDGNVKKLDKKVLDKKIDELAERAMRVLAFGYSEKKLTENRRSCGESYACAFVRILREASHREQHK